MSNIYISPLPIIHRYITWLVVEGHSTECMKLKVKDPSLSHQSADVSLHIYNQIAVTAAQVFFM